MSVTCNGCDEVNADSVLMCTMCGTVLNRVGSPAAPAKPGTKPSPDAKPSANLPPPSPVLEAPRASARPEQGRSSLSRPSDYGFDDAGFWLRALALVIDSFITLPLSVGLNVVIMPLFGTGDTPQRLSALVAFVIVFAGYGTAMESSRLHATLGKLALSLVVTDDSQEFTGVTRALFRNLLKAISLIIGLGLLPILNFVIAGFNDRKQTGYDLLTGSLVERKIRL
jgi:uncharacterized RDD family membrane protein YckC